MNKKSLSVLLSFLLIWVLFTASAWAGQVVTDEVKAWAKGAIEQEKALKTVSAPNTVAVLYFSNKTGWSDLDILQKGLTLMLITDLSKVEEIQVVERVKVQALVEELDLEVSGLVKPSTSSQMGKLLGVELLVGGDILKGKIEKLFQLKSNLLKVQTEKVVGRPWTEGELLAELFRMEKELLFEIIKELKIELSPELEAELKKPLTTNLTALLFLFEGIDHSDRGIYSKAAESYKKAMAEDPNLGQAEAFLWELQALNLWAGAIEAYSEPEWGGILEPADYDIPEDRDLTERVTEYIPYNFTFYGKAYDLDTSFSYGYIDLTPGDPFGADYPPIIAPLLFLEGTFGFAPQPVVKSDSFYKYTWIETSGDPRASFSATLYTNDESQDSDWIVFSYGDLSEPPGGYDVLVALSPGDGQEDHPGPGQPRGVVSVDLSEETGQTIPDDGGKYLTIYEEFSESGNAFDLVDSFLIYRPDGYNKYTVTAGTCDMVVDMSSLDEAIVMAFDTTLLAGVEGGDFIPGEWFRGSSPSPDESFPGIEDWEIAWNGAYKYGLQTVGQGVQLPEVFTNDEEGGTLDKINSNGFLAYAVQVEEDIVNRKILEMHQDAYNRDLINTLMGNINTALGYAEIRERDAWFTQQADAQAGRVLKDIHGNWVRIQQYVLRPDAQTVQVLNVCLRGAGGNLAGLSTMDWTTTFTDGYNGDLRNLPWNDWLTTQIDDNDDNDDRYVWSNINDPELETMYVKFTNPANESLKESRQFDTRVGGEQQYINDERLTINASAEYVYTGPGTLDDGQYQVVSTPAIGNNPSGFKYVFRSGGIERDVNVAFFVVGDAHQDDNVGEMIGYGEVSLDDIWDALRVNISEWPDIGNNNLEIVLDGQGNYFSNPIDVVYIPMSRMLWKEKDNEVAQGL